MAYFHKGFTYEISNGALMIEGNPISGDRSGDRGFRRKLRSGAGDVQALHELAKAWIDRSAALKERKQRRANHLAELAKGARSWNQWRHRNPDVQPMFAAFDFSKQPRRRLIGYDFSYANFTGARLKGLTLSRANFHQAILAKADLTGASLRDANFCRADLYETILVRANLTGANLQGAQLVRNELHEARLAGCTVYGASTWDLRQGSEKGRVRIRYDVAGEEQELEVQGLDVASFLYSTLNNRNISRVVSAAAQKWVLILGRFSKRKRMLEAIRDHLKHSFIPIIFDFEKAPERDLIEQLLVMAGMSCFVIVEITDARSAALELYAITSTFGVPVYPVIDRRSKPFGMFSGLSKFRWLAEPIKYSSRNHLLAQLDERVPELVGGR